MTSRRIVPIAVTLATVTLTAGAGFAQSGDASFQAQLNEAKSSIMNADNEARGTVSTHLSAAQSLYAEGKEAEAERYLRFARSRLGLDTTTVNPATQVGEGKGARNALN